MIKPHSRGQSVRRRTRIIRSRYFQAGQSLTELLVVSFALVPLFLLIPMIAKYQDIAHTTQVASRYAAFDATIHNDQTNGFKPAEQLAQEVRRRFFSNPDAAIKTHDAAGDFKAHQNLAWRDPKDNSLIEHIDDVAVQLVPAGATDTDGAGGVFMASQGFDLNHPPLYRGKVEVPLLNLPAGVKSYEPFDNIDLRVGRQTTVMIADWAGENPDQVNDRVRGSQSNPLADVGSVMGNLDLMRATSIASDAMALPFLLFELGKVEPPRMGKLDRWSDVVPADRLRAEGDGP